MLEQEFLDDLKTALATAREENATVVGHDRVQVQHQFLALPYHFGDVVILL